MVMGTNKGVRMLLFPVSVRNRFLGLQLCGHLRTTTSLCNGHTNTYIAYTRFAREVRTPFLQKTPQGVRRCPQNWRQRHGTC